jgi:hypothetical protein
VKELAGLQYIKQEPFSSLYENSNEPTNISGLEREQSLVMKMEYDIDIKDELLLEEPKPLIEELVAVAPFTPQEGVTLPAVSCNVVLNVYRTISTSCYMFIDKVEYYCNFCVIHVFML